MSDDRNAFGETAKETIERLDGEVWNLQSRIDNLSRENTRARAEIERLRGLVRSGHRMQLYNGQTRQPDGTMLHRTTALCLACDWHWRSGDPGDYLDIHAAHVDALLNPKEHR